MKMLTLRLDELAVETFDTTAAARHRGTVVGEEQSIAACTQPGYPSCNETCFGTCEYEYTCWESCWFTCDDITCITCEGDTCVNCPTAEFTCTCP